MNYHLPYKGNQNQKGPRVPLPVFPLSTILGKCSNKIKYTLFCCQGNTRPTRNGTLIPLFSCNKVLKLSRMHAFLKSELELYSIECCGVYPPDMLAIPTSPSRRQSLISHASLQDTSITGQQEELIEKRKGDTYINSNFLSFCLSFFLPSFLPSFLSLFSAISFLLSLFNLSFFLFFIWCLSVVGIL